MLERSMERTRRLRPPARTSRWTAAERLGGTEVGSRVTRERHLPLAGLIVPLLLIAQRGSTCARSGSFPRGSFPAPSYVVGTLASCTPRESSTSTAG